MLLVGKFPGAKDAGEMEIRLNHLIDSGIRYYINLMEETETDFNGDLFVSYEEILMELAALKGIRISCDRLSIEDFNVPSVGKMKSILDSIDRSINNKEPVYVHCLGGVGRTGTVVGCYLIRHGLASKKDVLDKIQFLRRDIPGSPQASPETGPQREMIWNWAGYSA